MTVALCSLL